MIYEKDEDFGEIGAIDAELMIQNDIKIPVSSRIDQTEIEHLNEDQRERLLKLLDKYSDIFSETPGFVNKIEHEIPLMEGFVPKRLKAYRVPENLKPEVRRQIEEMLKLGIIRPSNSPMASPLVCVLKGKDGKGGLRLAVNYQYVNKYTRSDALPMPRPCDVIQKLGKSSVISTFDAKSGYWQIPVKQSDQWLTAFVCDEGEFEFSRAPFGLKGSGNCFVRNLQLVLEPLKDIVTSYVDDMAVGSNSFDSHLKEMEKYFKIIRESGLSLSLKKSNFVKSEVKFVGHLVGSGQHRVDPDRTKAMLELRSPKTKKEVRQIMGFFSFFRDYIPDLAGIAKPITDLTAKHVPNHVPWGFKQQQALDKIKDLLKTATLEPLQIIDSKQPFSLFVEASDDSVAGVLTQSGYTRKIKTCGIC